MANPDDVTITVDMDARCTRCRKKGAMQNGLCILCATRTTMEGLSMEGRTKGNPKARHAAEQAQPPLIPMSREELGEAAQDLARKVAELEEMEAEHGKRRKEMRDTRNALLATIGAVASTIRSHGR